MWRADSSLLNATNERKGFRCAKRTDSSAVLWVMAPPSALCAVSALTALVASEPLGPASGEAGLLPCRGAAAGAPAAAAVVAPPLCCSTGTCRHTEQYDSYVAAFVSWDMCQHHSQDDRGQGEHVPRCSVYDSAKHLSYRYGINQR